MDSDEKRLLQIGLIGGFVVGCCAGFLAHVLISADQGRFALKESGMEGCVYKIDTKTGQAWFLFDVQQTPCGEPPPPNLQFPKPKTPAQ